MHKNKRASYINL